MMNSIKKHEQIQGRIQCEFNDIIKLELMGFIECPARFHGKGHFHPFWELLYVYQGTGNFQCENELYHVKPEDLVLFKPEESHQFTGTGEQAYANFYIGFSFNFSPEISINDNFSVLLDDVPELMLLRETIKELCANPKLSDQLMLTYRYRILNSLIPLADYLTENTVSADPLNREMILVKKAKDYIAQNLKRHISSKEVAALFYLSPHYVADLFKKNTGQSIKQYHHSLRMNEGLKLLKDTTYSVSEVSDILGFDSVHYFSKRFSAFFNISPSKFRKK